MREWNKEMVFRSAGDKCNFNCESNYAPICDQNGKIYTNRCVFAAEKCKNPALTYTSYPACDSAHVMGPYFPDGQNPNPREGASCDAFDCTAPEAGTVPVCDTRGALYANQCAYDEFKCLYPDIPTSPIPCMQEQLDEYEQFLEQARDRAKANATQSVDENASYWCKNYSCKGRDSFRWCDSNGKQYMNTCEMHKAACKDPSLTFKEGASCQPM